MPKALLASAAAVALVAMHRDPAEFPPPHTADVHPDEVANFVAGGWRKGEVNAEPQPQTVTPADMSREQMIDLHLSIVRAEVEKVSDDELRASLTAYINRQKFNGADPAAFDHDMDGQPGGSPLRAAASAMDEAAPPPADAPPTAADGAQGREASIEGGGEPGPGEQVTGDTTDGKTLPPTGDAGQTGPADAAPSPAHDYSDAAHAKSAQLTIAEIRADLTAMEVEFDPKAPKAELLSLRNAERQKRGKSIVGDAG